MNDLNTQQVILLCLLVSFVTSIATGITTVSLLEQAPEPVTQTINRVVERTVERVVEPEETEGEVRGDTTLRDDEPIVERVIETVVVNQEDLRVDAVAANKGSVVKIYVLNRFDKPEFVGRGVVVGASGAVLTDQVLTTGEDRFYIDYGTVQASSSISRLIANNGVLLTPNEPLPQTVNAISVNAAKTVQLGQTVIAVGGGESDIVATGIVTELRPAGQPTTILTDIAPASVRAGTILLNLKGEVVGVRIGQVSGISSFLTTQQLSENLAE